MNHKQILDKMAAGLLVSVLEQEIARLSFIAMAGHKNNWVDDKLDYVVSRLNQRWSCLLKHHKGDSLNAEIFNVVYATLLHKYGFQVAEISDAAIVSIDSLNKKVALSDSFYHKSADIKQFLKSAPKELKRYPKQSFPLTYFRPGDVVSFEFDGEYLAAYVYSIGPSKAPVVAFYDLIFKEPPSVSQLNGQPAYGQSYPQSDTPNKKVFEKYAINGMVYTLDPAEQICMIASAVELEFDTTGLEESMALSTDIELYDVEEIYNAIAGK